MSLVNQIQELEENARLLKIIVKMSFDGDKLNDFGKKISNTLTKKEMDIFVRVREEVLDEERSQSFKALFKIVKDMAKAMTLKEEYEYGRITSVLPARRNKTTNKIEFILWKKGEQGHEEDYWHEAGPGHTFIKDPS